MHNIRRFFALGALCLTLTLLLASPALAHGHHGGGHHGGYQGGSGYAGNSGTVTETYYYGGHYSEGGRQWNCGGRWCQTEITVCAVEGCELAGRHLHDGTLYCGYAHEGGLCNGACCELCPVEGCGFAGRHLHDGMVYCGDGHAAGFCDGGCAAWHHGY